MIRNRQAVRAVGIVLAVFSVLYSFLILFKLNSNFFPSSRFETVQLELPPLPVKERQHYSLADLYCLTRVVYGEAKGEDARGKHLVAMVVINRAVYSNTSDVCAVAQKAEQFHGYYSDMNVSGKAQFRAFAESLQIAEEALENYADAYVEEKHLLWFHADYVRPYWARSYDLRFMQGRHLFYRRNPDQV